MRGQKCGLKFENAPGSKARLLVIFKCLIFFIGLIRKIIVHHARVLRAKGNSEKLWSIKIPFGKLPPESPGGARERSGRVEPHYIQINPDKL